MEYFRELINGSKYFKYFQAGGVEKIVSERVQADSRSVIAYPLFFLEWPDLHVGDFGNNGHISFVSSFSVLDDPAQDDWQLVDQKMGETLNAVLQVLRRLYVDSTGLSKHFVEIDFSKVVIHPVDNILVDGAAGWRVEFSVRIPFDPCIEPGFWM